MNKNELKGLIVPVITPVNTEDQVDEASFRKIIRRLINSGVNAMFIGGSAGEGPLLTMKEWTRMMEIAFNENKSSISILGGVADTSVMKINEKIEVLKDIGYRYFVMTPSFYITLNNDEEFLRLFGECREISGDMEMIAYNIPSCTASVLPVEIMCEMARRGWIHYCKESSGDLDYFMELVDKGKELGLKVLMGDEPSMEKGLLAGACGIVPILANYDPETFIKLYNSAAEKNLGELHRMQERINLMRDNLVKAGTCWISGLKYAMACMGMGTGKPVSPLQPLSETEKKKVRDFISSDKRMN